MKKFLLLAAAAAALSMSAQETAPLYELNKVSEQKVTVANVTNTRQAFGMNGNFYVAEMNFSDGQGKVMVVTPNGASYTDIVATGSAISRDEAGNLILPATTFPNSWVADGSTDAIRVVNPETGDEKIYPLIPDFETLGRSDVLGFAKGDLMSDGVLYMVGAGFGANVGILAIVDGEVSEDESFVAPMSNSVVVNSQSLNHYFLDAQENECVLHVTRNATPQMMQLDASDNFECTAVPLPNKGAACGAHPFVFDGKNFIVYPTQPNYLDGFAIAEIGAVEATVEVPAVASANPNGSQSNWLNAEVVDENTVLIYQYVPGNDLGHATIYEFKKVNTAVSNVNAAKNVASVKYVNVAGQVSSEAFNGLNMVVTTYTDGSQATAKMVK